MPSRAVLDAAPGQVLTLTGADGAAPDAARPLPAHRVVADRRGQPALAGRLRRRRGAAGRARPRRASDRLRLPRPAVRPRRVPDDLRHHAGQRRDAERRPPVHARGRDPAGLARRRHRPGAAAHRRLVAGGGRGSAAGVVRGRRVDGPAGEQHPRRWRPHHRGRHDGDPRARVGRRGGIRAARRPAAAGPSVSSPASTRRGSSTGSSPAGTTRRRPTSCSSSRSPGRSSPRRPTTPPWTADTGGTSSATPRCSCRRAWRPRPPESRRAAASSVPRCLRDDRQRPLDADGSGRGRGAPHPDAALRASSRRVTRRSRCRSSTPTR